MSTVEDIEKAVEGLAPEQLDQFRAWFEAYDAALFDRRIAQDVKSGRLDDLAEVSLRADRRGQSSDL